MLLHENRGDMLMARCARYKTCNRFFCDLQSVYALHWQIGVDTITIVSSHYYCDMYRCSYCIYSDVTPYTTDSTDLHIT